MADEMCGHCGPDLTNEGLVARTPGWCGECGFFFDRWGMRILEPWRKCVVHKELLASCPHSGSLR